MTENWLILETSGRVARIGLARAGAIVGRAELDSSRRHAREMTSTIGTLLRAEGLAPADLTGVMASTGPGSYTGLRVGLVTAKVLAYALGCEFRAVGAFWAVAHQSPPEAGDVWVIADALQGQVYAQRFARRHDGWRPSNALQILTVAEFAAQVASGDWISGPGLGVHDAHVPNANPRVAAADREPRVESVFAVGAHLIQQLTKEEMFALEPLYLRGSSAEEKLHGPHG